MGEPKWLMFWRCLYLPKSCHSGFYIMIFSDLPISFGRLYEVKSLVVSLLNEWIQGKPLAQLILLSMLLTASMTWSGRERASSFPYLGFREPATGACWQENLEEAYIACSTAVVCLESGVQIPESSCTNTKATLTKQRVCSCLSIFKLLLKWWSQLC